MSLLQTTHHFIKAVSQSLDAIFDTGSDSLFKRNIQLAAIAYCIALIFQIMFLGQYVFGNLPPSVLPMVEVSVLVLLIGLYLLIVKKKHWLAIYLLVVYFIVKQNIMMSMTLNNLSMLSASWAHVIAYSLVFMLGVKKSIVPVTLYSGGLILQIFLRLDDSPDDPWNTPILSEFIYIQGLALFAAYYNEWSISKAFRERDQSREQEKKSTEAYARRVERLLDNKKQLLVDISHELRTPLSVLKANIEAMEDGINQHEESYPVLHRKLNQIDRLIHDIYFISKSDVQKLTLYIEPVFLSELMDELMSSFQPLANEKNLLLTMNKTLNNDITIEGDRQRLIQLFSNLLQNSLDYTDHGGQINLSSRALQSGIEITVQDSAPGVPEQEHLQLFERLYRKESSRNRATGGSGLGLSICKAIVEAHHGTIAIASSPLGGLAITSRLPFTQPTNTVTPLNLKY